MEDEDKKLDDDYIQRACQEKQIIKYVRSYFKRLTQDKSSKLIEKILNNNDGTGKPINIIELVNINSFKRFNLGKLSDNYLKPEVVVELRQYIKALMDDLDQLTLDEFTAPQEEEDGGSYKVPKTFIKLMDHVCTKGVDIKFKYNFDKPDLPLQNMPANTEALQRCMIQITSPGIKFGLPTSYSYICPECNKFEDSIRYVIKRNALKVASVNTIECDRIREIEKPDGTTKPGICGCRLKPIIEDGDVIDAWWYNIIYKEGDEVYTGTAISFNEYPPGLYECVLFRLPNPNKKEFYHIVDVKQTHDIKKFIMPEKVQGENYIITIQKELDKYLEEQTGMKIYGMNPIKVAMLMQAAFSYFNWDLIANIYLIGARSTGKTLLFRYWCPLLYGWYAYSTVGVSVSIPGLRGTEIKLNLLGKDITDLSIGYLGIFRSITIDEAGQNEDLVKDMKSFIYEMEYSMDKKGGKGVRYPRKAHINITSNLSIIYKSGAINEIKRVYKDLPEETNPYDPSSTLPKPDWDQRWDVYLPIEDLGKVYTIEVASNKVFPNVYLQKAVQKYRAECGEKDKWWIDGLDLAVHDRFPFYFYLVNEKGSDKLREVITENTVKDNLRKKSADIVVAVDTTELQKFFKEVKIKYEKGEEDKEGLSKVFEILDECDVENATSNARLEGFYQYLVKASRMINGRTKVTEEDYDLLRWMLGTTNRKVDIADMASYCLPDKPVCALPPPPPADKTTYTPDEAFGDYNLFMDNIPKEAWRK